MLLTPAISAATPRALLQERGRAALAEARPAAARRLCADAVRSPMIRAMALTCLGQAELARGDVRAALHLGRQALAIRGSLATRLLLGEALRALGRCQEALVHYHRAALVAPDHPIALRGGPCARSRSRRGGRCVMAKHMRRYGATPETHPPVPEELLALVERRYGICLRELCGEQWPELRWYSLRPSEDNAAQRVRENGKTAAQMMKEAMDILVQQGRVREIRWPQEVDEMAMIAYEPACLPPGIGARPDPLLALARARRD
jgi:tetratricopeptide (TPR) repeat protein